MPKKHTKKEPVEKSDKADKSVDLAVREIQEKYGEGSIMRLGEVRRVDVDVIPTGSLSLDLALGVGGVPRGRIIEVYGPEAGGKTTLCLHIVAEAQKKGGVAAYVDAEHALDPDYARRIGVNVDDLLISQPDTGEQALDIVESLVRSGGIDVVVVDSVAALSPQAEIEAEMEQQQMGGQARLMSRALRKLTGSISKSKTTVIFINQLRMKIGVMFGNPEVTPGGMALKFYSSVRIEIRRAAQIQAGERIIGNRVKIKIVKNKVAPPFKTAEFDILYNEGISKYADIVNAGVRYGVIDKSGSWFTYGKEKLGQGIEGARQFLKENPKLEKELVEKIKEASLTEETVET